MTKQEFTISYIKAVEKRHKDYFERAKLCIMDCVSIQGKNSVSVHITNDNLPSEVRHDIEMMFWIG